MFSYVIDVIQETGRLSPDPLAFIKHNIMGLSDFMNKLDFDALTVGFYI